VDTVCAGSEKANGSNRFFLSLGSGDRSEVRSLERSKDHERCVGLCIPCKDAFNVHICLSKHLSFHLTAAVQLHDTFVTFARTGETG
jgi:hypothetical protein